MTLSATPFSLVSVQGADATKFLQGQLTCDLASLEIGQVIPGAHCSAKGRVLHNFLIGKYAADDYLLQLPDSMVAIATTSLKKYAVFFKVTIAPADDFQVLHSASNTHMSDALASLSFENNLTVHWVRNGAKASFAPLESFAIEAGYIRARLVWITPSTSERFTPEEIGLTDIGAVSFKKGCYTGQEIVARMHYKGAHKRTIAAYSGTLPQDAVQNTGQDACQKPAQGAAPSLAPFLTADDEALSLSNSHNANLGTVINIASFNHFFCVLASVPRDLSNAEDLTFQAIPVAPLAGVDAS